MKIAMIIPTYNEGKTIEAMVRQLEVLPGDWEILFADGKSQDDTVEKIGGRFPVMDCPKGRANQMNAAAQMAKVDVLWFVHCDSVLCLDSHEQIERAIAQGAVWGCFHIKFDYDGPFMGCNTYLSNRRARKGIAFGDQGIWIKKEVFAAMGGFPALPIMEDYEFSLRMKRAGIPIFVVPGSIITSGRRYRKTFPLLVMWRMFYLRYLYRKGTDIRIIAEKYRDIR